MLEVIKTYPRLQVRLIIELPVTKVGERRGCTAAETKAIGRGAMGFGGDRRGTLHSGEDAIRSGRYPAVGGIGDPAAPLENKRKGGEREREEGEEEEELGREGLSRGRGVGGRIPPEGGVEVVARHGGSAATNRESTAELNIGHGSAFTFQPAARSLSGSSVNDKLKFFL